MNESRIDYPVQAEKPETLPVMVREPRQREADLHKYARQSRNANVFVAVVVALGILFSAIAIIWAINVIGNAANSVSGGGLPSGGILGNCQSVGGTDSSC
jgi:hypothetical protein